MLGVEVFRPLRELRMLLHAGMLGAAAARGILDLLDARPAVAERPRPVGDTALAPTVTFEDVRFAYPGARRIAHEKPVTIATVGLTAWPIGTHSRWNVSK